MKVFTKYERPEKVNVEQNSGELLVEKGGYIPMKRQIEQFMSSGERLAAARKAMSYGYDFAPGEDVKDDFYDPTREPGFDLADASALSRALEEKKLNSIKPKSTEERVEEGSEQSGEAEVVSEKADDSKKG